MNKHYFCEACDEVNDQPQHSYCSICTGGEDICRYCGSPASLMSTICPECEDDSVLKEGIIDEEDEEFLRGPYKR